MLIAAELLFIVLLSMMLFMVYKNERTSAKKSLPRAKAEEYWNGKERRRHVRFKKALELTYMVEKKPHLKHSRTVDISEGGLKLVLAEKLATGTIMDLRIALPNSRNTEIEIEGDVVWSGDAKDEEGSGKRLFYSGIKFFAIPEPSGTDLINYLRSLAKDSAV